MKAYGMEVVRETCPVCGREMDISCMMGTCFWTCPEESCYSTVHPQRVGAPKTEFPIDNDLSARLKEAGWMR